MRSHKLALALILSFAVISTSGCIFLPILPLLPGVTYDSGADVEIPADLVEAAERILPSTVIVDTRYATGTGWVFDESGIIVTNYHVIKDARNIMVTLPDGRRFGVKSAASDPISDLAVLYIDAPSLTAVAIGSSTTLKANDQVVAVGNSLGNGISVKTGRVTRLNMTVSIENQDFYGLIENSAPIKQGDSGGPLVNKTGEVIGISTARIVGAKEIAYAISIDSALPVLYDLITNGAVVWPYLGITGRDNPAGRGVLVEEVSPGSPAAEAGLRADDIILEIDDTPMSGMTELRRHILFQEVGQSITVTYRRDGVETKVSATLAARPA